MARAESHLLRVPLREAPERAVVAVNARASRLRDPQVVLESILAATAGSSVDVSGTITETDDDVRAAVAQAEGGRLIIADADGGVHFALNAADGPLEIGLVPVGTRDNNIARSLGLSRALVRAARHAVSAPSRAVDVLRVETPDRALFAIEGVSAGLQADARARYESVRPGQLIEGTSAFATALGQYEPWRFEVELDGRHAYSGDAAELFLSNFPLFAYGFKVGPDADMGEGLLEAVLLEADSRHRVARLVLAAYRGTLAQQSNVKITRAREAVIKTAVPLVCDSQVLGTTTASVRVEQGRLRIAA